MNKTEALQAFSHKLHRRQVLLDIRCDTMLAYIEHFYPEVSYTAEDTVLILAHGDESYEQCRANQRRRHYPHNLLGDINLADTKMSYYLIRILSDETSITVELDGLKQWANMAKAHAGSRYWMKSSKEDFMIEFAKKKMQQSVEAIAKAMSTRKERIDKYNQHHATVTNKLVDQVESIEQVNIEITKQFRLTIEGVLSRQRSIMMEAQMEDQMNEQAGPDDKTQASSSIATPR